MSHIIEQHADFHLNSQFLVQLPSHAFFKRFALLALATGEFPQAAEVIARQTPGYQQPPVAENQAGRNFNQRF